MITDLWGLLILSLFRNVLLSVQIPTCTYMHLWGFDSFISNQHALEGKYSRIEN